MILLEHVAKSLLKEYSIAIPDSFVVKTEDLLANAAFPCVLKSQVPVGGRGKLGGIRLVSNTDQAINAYRELQTHPIKGHLPTAILCERALSIEREVYLALRINRDERRIDCLASVHGGIDIEQAPTPPTCVPIDDAQLLPRLAQELPIPFEQLEPLVAALLQAFVSNDCTLLEINPLVVTKTDQLVCADAKIDIDDNARFRQPSLPWPTNSSAIIATEDGTIGCLANGAGMAMATMDAIVAAGGRPANFLDIGGGTGKDIFVSYLRDINQLPGVAAIIVNIFAGITRCDEIAQGIIAAKAELTDCAPLFIRLEGTNRQAAVELLEKEQIAIEKTLADCIKKAMVVSA